jgi:hypothetical protein
MNDVNTKDPLANWFLNRWSPIGIGGISGLMTIVFAFFNNWKLALGILVGGGSLGFASWLIQFYRKQLLQREGEFRKALLQREEQLKSEFAAAREAREAVVVNRETTINQLNSQLKHIKSTHKAVVDAMYRFIEAIRVESGKLYDEYKKLSKTDEITKGALANARKLGNSFLLEALESIINIFKALVPPLEDGAPIKLWAAFRQHNPNTKTYDTVARHGEYTKVRELGTEGIPEERSIPKIIIKTYNEDGSGIVIIQRDHPDYDKVENDKFNDNLSIMAGPIIIENEMPMFVALNSPQPNVFHDEHKLYMQCCTSLLSESIKSWSELIEMIK